MSATVAGLILVPMEYGPFPDLESLGAAIAADLCSDPDPCVAGNAAIVAEEICRAIGENLRIEEEINREAEAALRKLGADASGMDRGNLLSGIRERLAKQRGFVL